MKKALLGIVGIILLSGFHSSGQKHDYVWLSGYDSHIGFDSSWGFYFGTDVVDFNYSPRQIGYDSLEMNFSLTNTSFCDSDGNLMFYTNGVYIANSIDEKIENSDSLNAGYFQHVAYPLIQTYGYRNEQGVLAIPVGDNKDRYYVLHSWIDSFQNNFFCKKVLLSLLDMSENVGHGKVVFKNQTVIDGLLGWELAATRHGNGRDWWLLVQKHNTNCYYRVLIDSNGVHALPSLTCGGSSPSLNDHGASCFSPDGSKYVYLSYFTGLNIFNFDRCTGELSNPLQMPFLAFFNQNWYSLGVAISPNSRFLYVSGSFELYQIDLWASDVVGSIDTVGIYDGAENPFGSFFANSQIGPDGKIYISCRNGETVYHVINNPDAKGDSCDFQQHSIHLPGPSLSVPSFPNYRLGTLQGSSCDTLTDLTKIERSSKESILLSFPNPATDFVVFDYGFTDWNKGDIELEITNELGQLICGKRLPRYSGFQKVDISLFANGIYNARIKRGNAVVAVSKFVKQ